MKDQKMFPLDLQFFAEEDNQSGNEGNGNEGNGNDDQTSNGNSGEKTFTQTEVSNMMAKEKNEGKRSILKSLGFKTEDEAKEAITKYNELVESKKTEDQKAKEALKKIQDDSAEAIKRATIAENKLACFALGIGKEYVDDVLAIASNKVTEDKDLETVLKEMKDDKKYESFFIKENSGSDSSNNSGGTGSNAGHSGNQGGKKESFGERLAKQNKPANVKSSFFND